MKKHTPTPWNTDGENIFYCPPKNHESIDSDLHIAKVYVPEGSEGPQAEGIANAELICRAVNAHEELIAVINDMLGRYERLEKLYGEKCGIQYDCANGTIERAKQAIAKAEGE